MKVISIQQPWASLIAIGEKKFETRSWATKYRGELLIHASKKIDHNAVMMLARDYTEVWRRISPLKTGYIIAKCNLTDCYKIHEDHTGDAVLLGQNDAPEWWIGKATNEYEFGDYTEGRFAWKLQDVKPIEPIPAKGQLGLWNFDVGGSNGTTLL